MATASLEPRLRVRDEHTVFQAFAALIVVVVFVGFAQTYFLSGLLTVPPSKAALGPPHPWIVHLHAVIFTLWVCLLAVQTSLIRTGRVGLHRRVGVFGFVLAALVVLSGTAVVCENLARHGGGATQIFWVFAFALLTWFGYRQRRNPRTHKRLMLSATIMLLPAPLVRWPVLLAGNFPLAVACCYVLLLSLACYDVWSTRKIQPGTLWGSAAFIVTHAPFAAAFTHNVVWTRIAAEMKAAGHLFL